MIELIFAAGLCVAVDGDTLACDGHRIRLHGIDAPDYTCAGRGDWCREDPRAARAAHNHLDYLVRNTEVRCLVRGKDRYGRDVAVCSVAGLLGGWFQQPGGYSLNCMMVAAGHAIDWPKYSGGAYAKCGRP